MMGALAGPVVKGLASGAIGAGLNSLFGGGGPKISNFLINSVRTPGLNLTRSGGDISVTRGPGVSGPLAELQRLADQQAGELGGLLSRVRPGFSELRKSRLAGLETARRRSVGDLRENLARRRISGSSFASDTIARAESEFSQLEDKIRAESTLAELDAFNKILTQQFETLSTAASTALSQANVEASLGANFASGVQANLTSMFNTQAQLAAGNAAGLGSFFQPIISEIGGALGGLFSGGGGNTQFDSTDYR